MLICSYGFSKSEIPYGEVFVFRAFSSRFVLRFKLQDLSQD